MSSETSYDIGHPNELPSYRSAPTYNSRSSAELEGIQINESYIEDESTMVSDSTKTTDLAPRGSADLIRNLPSSNPDAYPMFLVARKEGRQLDEKEVDALVENMPAQPSIKHDRNRSTIRVQLRARKSMGASLYEPHRASHDDLDEQNPMEAVEDSKQLIKDIKEVPQISLQEKREILREEKRSLAERIRTIPLYYRVWVEFTQAFQSTARKSKTWIRSLGLWNTNMKRLEGIHGNTVATYFLFLRWSLFMNLIISLLWVCFLIIPFGLEHTYKDTYSLLVPSPDKKTYTSSESIVGLFTGGGALNRSAYFMGSYMISSTTNSDYNFALAYLMTGAAYLFYVFIAILMGLHDSVYRSAAFDVDEGQNPISELVFASYDYSLTDPKSILLKQTAVARLIKEIEGEQEARARHEKTASMARYVKRVVVNVIVLGILAVALYIIQLSVVKYSETETLKRLVPAIILAVFNIVLPFAFEILARLEEWRTPLFVIQITVFRAIILRIAGLYVFFYTHYIRRVKFMCWESYVAQQAYNLFIVVFVFELFTSIVVDPLKKHAYENHEWIRNYMQTARFQTIKNTLELIYSQALVWFGVFFCPILAIIAFFKTIVLFYVKEWITLKFCAPPLKAFRANRSLHSLIYAMHFVSLICILLPLGYTIVRLPTSGAFMPQSSQDRWLAGKIAGPTCTTNDVYCSECLTATVFGGTVCYVPEGDVSGNQTTLLDFCSKCQSGCGPFRNQENMYQTIVDEFHSWPSLIRDIIQFMGTLAFAVIVLFLVGVWLFYERARSRARYKRLLKTQVERDMERMDKRWILKTYSIVLDPSSRNKMHRKPSKHRDHEVPTGFNDHKL